MERNAHTLKPGPRPWHSVGVRGRTYGLPTLPYKSNRKSASTIQKKIGIKKAPKFRMLEASQAARNQVTRLNWPVFGAIIHGDLLKTEVKITSVQNMTPIFWRMLPKKCTEGGHRRPKWAPMANPLPEGILTTEGFHPDHGHTPAVWWGQYE